MVQSGQISVGELTSFFLYTAYVGSSMIGLSSWYSELMKGLGASTRLFSLLDEKAQIESRTNGHVLNTFSGCIEFKNISFSYPTRENAVVFKDLNFEIKAGEHVAIVGSSGSVCF